MEWIASPIQQGPGDSDTPPFIAFALSLSTIAIAIAIV
jgi:hypothetical protein